MIRREREEKDLSMRAVAFKAKLSYESVRLLELGRGGIKALRAVLQALDFPSTKQTAAVRTYFGL
jgi:transcriptional regulator with XRE-family HTH domain